MSNTTPPHSLDRARLLLDATDSEAAQFSRILAFLPDAILCIDRSWHMTYANAEAIRLARLRPERFATEDLWQTYPCLAGSEFERRLRAAMASGANDQLEFSYEPFNAWFDISVISTDAGVALCFRDNSERKLSQRRAAEAAEQLRLVFEATPDGVVVIDSHWRFTFANHRALQMVGRSDILGKDIFELFPGNAQEPFHSAYRSTMETRLVNEFEAYQGEPLNLWFRVQAKPYRQGDDEGIIVFFSDISQQRSHDEIVRGQQELLASVQTAARMATWDFEPLSGAILYGPGSFPVFGYPLEQLAKLEQFIPILFQDHLERLQAEIKRSTASGGPMLVEFAVTSPAGKTIWVESRGEAYRAVDGAMRIRGMFIDVTQRHLDQQDLVASEARYRVLADLNPQAIWMGDAEGNFIYANQGFMAYIGLTAADLGGNGWLEAFAPEERHRVKQVWVDSVASGEDYDLEARLRHAESGQYRYWHLRAAPVRDASGTILHWLGVAQDIHETKTYTAALRAEQMETEARRAELETIYSTTPVGLALFDPVALTFLNLNEHEAEMLGAKREHLLGKPLAEIATPEKIPQVFEYMRTAAAGTPVRNQLLEGELSLRPGERRFWNVNYSPIFNEDGSVRAISTASIEITNQKRAEAALIQSEKLAAVGRLASSISHEINNPLEAITNLLYLISLDEELPGHLRVYVHMAQSELSRVSQIATQTLRFHRQAVAPTMVTASELVSAVIRLYTGRLVNSNIQVDARYLTDTQILCFENDIRQILNNLIANAIDAMRTGGRLIVRAHEAQLRTPGPGDARARRGVRITIADTGHGMNQATIRRIFEPFFTTKDLNGTGLGLWISAGIIERHQGSIRVRSSDRPGHSGTVFTLFLPCEEQPSTQQ